MRRAPWWWYSPWWRRLRLPALALAVLVTLVLGSAPASATVHTGARGLRLIESFEGLVLTPQPDPVGIPTLCFGQTAADGPLPSHATPAECERMLRRSLARGYEPPVRALFLPSGRLRGLFNQHRFDALVSLAYNVGPGVLPRVVASRNLHAVATSMLAYDHAAGVVLPGLYHRRHAEAALFLAPMGRFELFPALERHLIVVYDHGHLSLARRARIVAAMRHDAAEIARVARRERDWLSHRRLTRFDALERRFPHPR